MKVKELVELLQEMPQDYDITYQGNIGHMILKEKQVKCFNAGKEVFLQMNVRIRITPQQEDEDALNW